MAQCEQTTLYFDVDGEIQAGNGYVDLAAAMTAANRKQYHQVSRDGTAKCYRVRVTPTKGTFVVDHLQNQFATCNAVKQVSAGWKAQMRHGGIKLRDLPPYGRRPRFALETNAYFKNTTAISGETVYEISDLHTDGPQMSPAGDLFFGNYTATDGMVVYYKTLATPAAGSIAANQITQVTVTDGAGTETNVPLVMSGNAESGEFNVITNYMKARRASPDVSIDTPGPTEGAEMLNLFSVAEEMSDDIVDAIEEYMDWKPYTTDNAPNAKFDHLTEGCTVKSTSVGEWPPASDVVDAPLGLLKLSGSTDGDTLRIDVLAIYEM